MFCPLGPAAVAASGSPANLVFGGINRNNPVLRVDFNGVGQLEVTLNTSGGPLVTFYTYAASVNFFHIPDNVVSVDLTPSGGGATAASAVVGEDV